MKKALLATLMLFAGAGLACETIPDPLPRIEPYNHRPLLQSGGPVEITPNECPDTLRVNNSTGEPRTVHWARDGVVTSETQPSDRTWVWGDDCTGAHEWECKGTRVPTNVTACQNGACITLHECDLDAGLQMEP